MIAFRALTKRFSRVEAVRSLTATIAPGEIVALVGPNGSGKTTTIKAAAGLIWPTSGEVRLGEAGRPATDPAARDAAAFLPQRVAFPEALTGREVLEFYATIRPRAGGRTAEVLRFTGLNGASRRPVGTYSGGMRQRLALAVALLPDAPVLLLDEPTASLDQDGLEAFYRLIEAGRARGQTVLFSSHQMGDVERLADRFLVLVRGALTASLTARELSERLAARGRLRLDLDGWPDGLLDRVRAIAPGAERAGESLEVPAVGAEARLAVIDLVRSAGAGIRGLAAEDGRLEDVYRELVGGQE